MSPFLLPAALAGAGLGLSYWQLHRRSLDRWLLPYLMQSRRRRAPRPGQPVHLLLCIADHYEPKLGKAPPDVAQRRVARWADDYPRLFSDFRDSDGRPPRHSFFYPQEEYEPEYLDALADLCRAGFGEVEIHLHHDHDTADGLRDKLLSFKSILADRHGLLARDRRTGEVRYAFIHGNWALCNSRPDGRWCGVNNELDILRETGCYVDMTMPSAPASAQTRKINSIYYARNIPGRPRSHDTGIDAGTAPPPPDSLLLIQGPLLFNWSSRKWGLVPRLENGCLQGNQPPTLDRLRLWLKARVQVATRPDWFFVKLHTHGASERNADMLLGEPMLQFHRDLARLAQENPDFHYHYVTAREMVNLARAAEDGWAGDVRFARDYVLASPLGSPTDSVVDTSRGADGLSQDTETSPPPVGFGLEEGSRHDVLQQSAAV